MAANKYAKYLVQPDEEQGGGPTPAPAPASSNKYAKYLKPVEAEQPASPPVNVSVGATGEWDLSKFEALPRQTPTAAQINAENPIVAEQRRQQDLAGRNFAAQQPGRMAKEAQWKDELAAMNAAGVVPFKNNGPDGPLELNQERPDLLAGRAAGAFVNSNIGVANTAGQVGLQAANAYGAAFDPNFQGALAGNEYGDNLDAVAEAATKGGYTQNAGKVGDIIPSLPIPAPATPGEVGADVAGNLGAVFTGWGAPVMKGGQALSETLAAVPGLSRTLRGIGVETGENAILGYGMGAGAAPPGSDRNMAGVQSAADPLNYLSIEALRALGRVPKAIDRAFPATPTNAGGARPGAIDTAALEQPPVTAVPPSAPTPRPAQVATPAPAANPSVAPVAASPIPQAPPTAAQARAASAGQQGAGPAVLNATPVAPTVSKAQVQEAKDTAVILGRILKASGIKGDAVRGYLPGLVQRYESLGDSRIPLARFVERDLPQYFPETQAGDAITKLRAHGRESNARTSPKDSSRSTVQGTIKALRSTQQDHLTDVIRTNTYKKELIDAEDKIRADMRKNAEAGYETALANGIDRFAKGKVTVEEASAWNGLERLMKSEPFTSRIPDHVKVQAMRSGKTLEQMIEEDPFRTAHWLQSALGKAERAAQGLGGKATPESLLYKELRQAVLDPLEQAVPGYKGARHAHGDLYGADEALAFGDDLFTAARTEVETARKARDFNKLSKAQQTVATMSIRDKLLNEFRGTPEEAAAKLTRLQQEGVLDAIERILGADGKRITSAIRDTVEENDWLRAIDQGAGSNTYSNLVGGAAAAENVKGPINKAIGSLGDKRTYLGAAIGDAVLMGVGVPPVLTVGKAATDLVSAAGKPSARRMSNSTKGLYGLPAPKATGIGATPQPKVRGPRKVKPPEQLEADLETLLKQYDAVDHRNNPTESARILKKIDALKKRMPGVPAQTGMPTPVRKKPLPGETSSASPTVTGALVGGGLGYAASDGDPRATLAGAVGGGVLGRAAGKFGSGRKAPRPVEKPNALANAGRSVPPGRGKATPLGTAEKVLADPAIASQLSEDQFAPLFDAVNAEMKRLQAKTYTLKTSGEKIPYTNTPEGYAENDRLNKLLMNWFKLEDGSIDFDKVARWAERNDPDRAMRVSAGRVVNDLEDGVVELPPSPGAPKPVKNGLGSSSLPMDEASRMERAREWGKGYQVFEGVHTTSADFDSFDPAKIGKTDPGWYGRGHYFTPVDESFNRQFTKPDSDGYGYGNYDYSNGHINPPYKEGTANIPVLIRMKKPFTGADANNAKIAEAFAKAGYKGISRDWRTGKATGILKPGLRSDHDIAKMGKSRLSPDDTERLMRTDSAEFTAAAQKLGYDGANWSGEIVVFPGNEANIRGKFAKFDPAESSSSKLLAGLQDNATGYGAAGGMVAGGAFAQDTDGDGKISPEERAAGALGGAITGGVLGKAASYGMGKAARRLGPPTIGRPSQNGFGGGRKGPPAQKGPPKKAEEIQLRAALRKARSAETAVRNRTVMRDNRDELRRPAEEAVMQAERNLNEYLDRQYHQAANAARWKDRGEAVANAGKKAATATGNVLKRELMKEDAALLKVWAAGTALGGGALAIGSVMNQGGGKKPVEAIPPTDPRYFMEKVKDDTTKSSTIQNALVALNLLSDEDADGHWGVRSNDAVKAWLSKKPGRNPKLPLQNYEVPELLAEAYGGYEKNNKWYYNNGEPVVFPLKTEQGGLPSRPLRPDEVRRLQYRKRTEANQAN